MKYKLGRRYQHFNMRPSINTDSKMQRELITFPLHPNLRSKLSSAGFVTVEDILDLKVSELCKDLGIGADEALELRKLVQESVNQPNASHSFMAQQNKEVRTAFDMLQEEQQTIVTFSERLDDLLSGGIQIGKITEFCGPPSIGKTQLCMQLAVDVQIPECCGGVDGEAIYIDTEGSFVVERAAEIARATMLHCHNLIDDETNEMINNFDVNKILSSIHYFRCFDYVQLMALMHLLDDFILKHKKVKLILLDSIAYPFRQDFDDFSLRTRLLNGVTQTFNKLAATHKLAIVLTNQMTTRFSKNEKSHLIPALGESWGHSCTYRIILYWEHQQRHALLYKSPSKKESSIPYQITVAGIRDVCQKSHPTVPRERTDKEMMS